MRDLPFRCPQCLRTFHARSLRRSPEHRLPSWERKTGEVPPRNHHRPPDSVPAEERQNTSKRKFRHHDQPGGIRKPPRSGALRPGPTSGFVQLVCMVVRKGVGVRLASMRTSADERATSGWVCGLPMRTTPPEQGQHYVRTYRSHPEAIEERDWRAYPRAPAVKKEAPPPKERAVRLQFVGSRMFQRKLKSCELLAIRGKVGLFAVPVGVHELCHFAFGGSAARHVAIERILAFSRRDTVVEYVVEKHLIVRPSSRAPHRVSQGICLERKVTPQLPGEPSYGRYRPRVSRARRIVRLSWFRTTGVMRLF